MTIGNCCAPILLIAGMLSACGGQLDRTMASTTAMGAAVGIVGGPVGVAVGAAVGAAAGALLPELPEVSLNAPPLPGESNTVVR